MKSPFTVVFEPRGFMVDRKFRTAAMCKAPSSGLGKKKHADLLSFFNDSLRKP
jgi:hypothetical protein